MSQRRSRLDSAGTPSRTDRPPRVLLDYKELWLGAAALAVVAVWSYPRGTHPITGQSLLLAGALLVACWLVDSFSVPVGLDRAGRVLSLSGVNALLFPAAILLPPSLFLAVALGSELPAIPRRGWRKPLANGAIRAGSMGAAAIVFWSISDEIDLTEVPVELESRTIVGLIAAALVMLAVESVATGRLVRTSEGLLSVDIPLIDGRELLRGTPDVTIGALACVLLATAPPVAVVLLVPLFLLQATVLRGHAARLGGHRDAKTGLLTFEVFLDLANRELARATRTGQPVSMLMMDLDGLKAVNTAHGHLAGDRFIAEMAGVLQRSCRAEDLVSRFGGDEFCLLLPGADLAGSIAAAERIRRTAEATTVGGLETPVLLRVSIGATQVTTHDTLDSVLTRADGGLRNAKRLGGNRVEAVAAPAVAPASFVAPRTAHPTHGS